MAARPLKGYAGRIAFVNLYDGSVQVRSLREEDARLFLGGKGLLYLLGYKLIAPSARPLDPRENAVIIAAGALAAHAPGASKTGFLAKSPLTGILCDSYAGQVFAGKLRMAGFDALVVRGRAEEPVYIYVEDGEVEVRPARHLWGSGTWDTWLAVRRETRSGASVATIGPAGERMVRYANVIVDGFRAAGRCGIGAVMGSMGLKAVAVWGTRVPERARPEEWRRLYLRVYERMRGDEAARAWARYGTNDGVSVCSRLSMCPRRHWRMPWSPPEEAERLSGDRVLERQASVEEYKRYAGVLWGWGCPLKCSKLAKPRKKGMEHIVVKPEYENLAMLGLAPDVLDPDEVLVTQKLVNDLGLDSISFGETVSWLLELLEEGLIRPEDTGLPEPPRFGDPEAVRTLARLVAERRGIGAVLAEGVERAAQILGSGADRAVHVKGLEAAAWDPRGRRGLAVSYATADVGASHLRGWPSPHQPPTRGPAAETVESMIRDRDWKAMLDSMGLCSFLPYRAEEITSLYTAATGIEATIDELLLVGWRTEALARIHAAQAARVPEGDTIPRRWMEPIPEGPLKGAKAALDWSDLRAAIQRFYQLRGYDPETGIPTKETLEKLGLAWAIPDAEKAIQETRWRLGSVTAMPN